MDTDISFESIEYHSGGARYFGNQNIAQLCIQHLPEADQETVSVKNTISMLIWIYWVGMISSSKRIQTGSLVHGFLNKVGDMLAMCLYSVSFNLISDNIRCGIKFISLNFDGWYLAQRSSA